MTEERIHHTTDDGHTITVHHWPADPQTARGVVIWLHGMAEHGARYAPLATYLNTNGWHLYCPDHRGHGGSISEECPKGHFGDHDGWSRVLADTQAVIERARQFHPGIPCVLGGHSMGSLIALAVAEQLGDQLDGLMLCGSDYHPGSYYRMMQVPISLARYRNGKRGISPLIRNLTFGAWAKTVPSPRTEFDWLSTDTEEVEKYRNDALCGFDCTTETWHQLVAGLRRTHSVAQLSELPDDLPVLLLAGEQDPVSNQGKGMMALEAVLHAMEQPTRAHFWPNGRHEILNDACRDEVHQAIGEWLSDLQAGRLVTADRD